MERANAEEKEKDGKGKGASKVTDCQVGTGIYDPGVLEAVKKGKREEERQRAAKLVASAARGTQLRRLC